MGRKKGGFFMDLCDIRQIKALLERHGFHFSKARGQNFLIADWVPREIAESAGIDETCGVLEVGPGIGPLTKELCRRAGRVVAVEVDTALQPVLAETMAGNENLEILFRDILKTDIPALVAASFPDLQPVACANLPYYITTPVLAALLESRCFSAVTVMVQKEVAERICSPAGKPEYGAFSVFCQYYAEPELLFEVPPSCFIPQPKVTSAVLTLRTRPAPPCRIASEQTFFRVVRSSFAQRRKTLVNGLSAGFGEYPKQQIAELLVSCGLSPTVRGETLDLAGFARVANAFSALEA
jgi:16S rRNA (adenine1518-N6/adenine1519-N6)-dimethyltransferase